VCSLTNCRRGDCRHVTLKDADVMAAACTVWCDCVLRVQAVVRYTIGGGRVRLRSLPCALHLRLC